MIVIREEYDFDDSWFELFERHYEEVQWNTGKIKLNINREKYDALIVSGNIRGYVARDEGRIVGYAIWILGHHQHFKDTVFAYNDLLYVAPEHRKGGTGIRLIKYSEKMLKEQGVDVMTLQVKKQMDWSRLAEYLGYDMNAMNYQKWIGD